MTKLEEVLEEIASRSFPETYVEVLPLGKASSSYSVLFQMRNWHRSHLDLVKTYPIKFNGEDKQWEGSAWVIRDLLIPKMNIPDKNVFIHPAVKRMMRDVENSVLLPTRASLTDLHAVPPLEGLPPYETFQLDAVQQILQRKYYGVFLKQGLGKSYVIATSLRKLFRSKIIQRAIVCTPGTGLIDIKRKILQFAPDEFSAEDILIVNKNNRECFAEENKQRILVMTYSTLRLVRKHYDTKAKPASKTFKRFLTEWLGEDALAFVPDEGHYLANPTSQQSKAAAIVSEASSVRIVSTGTPADKPEKYYNILKTIHPYFVRFLGYTDWCKSVANIGTAFSSYAISEFRPEDLRHFIKTAETHYVSIMDDKALDLPPHYQKPILIPLEAGRQRKIYELFSSKQLEVLKRTQGDIYPRSVLNRFPYLLLSLDNPDILKNKPIDWHVQEKGELDVDIELLNKTLQSFTFEKDHQKLEYVYELLDEHCKENGEKCVVWTGHPDTAEALAPLLKKYNRKGTNVLTIHGRTKRKGMTTDDVKDAVIQEFRSNDNHRILIASYMVLETAVDLVEASCQIYFDEPYAMVQKDQSMKRLHRAGQDKPVTTYMLIFADTIDETRHAVISGKILLDRNALDKTMPLEDWRRLFTGEVPQTLQSSLDEAQELF